MPVSPAGAVTSYFLGLDLGQTTDHAALCAIERRVWPGEFDAASWERPARVLYDVRHLERFPLGTRYPAIVERVATVCDGLAAVAPLSKGELAFDLTGVGGPVCDLLIARRLPYPLRGISIHGGDRVNSDTGRGIVALGVPKRDLVASVVVLFQSSLLRIAESLPLAGALVQELVGFRMKVSAAGHDSYGNGREVSHDDLVMALALAAWRAHVRQARPLGVPRPLLR